ncbi:hypothetical protein KCV87_35170 [Actinosynnema pretiosum subsp. pretiosum]|uniref:Lipoprotein n=2 Tax=Actinosynnema TaxID=40566 RepID=C6WH69_ACTMD|nr:hypothetical protein [Actinosynnema mirum]ACU37988.1 hypothetical protein Amir_4133 [Actinosynnema mirum DSM 43827]AXX31484.1 hypothetical protein APASM_4119 [Actinosynnema pretiosum subsp. pretiosum]QUF04482.1 hypothetical protein KCV87_35170 [Actinosynnema pretiosum subsp. pretiosum]
MRGLLPTVLPAALLSLVSGCQLFNPPHAIAGVVFRGSTPIVSKQDNEIRFDLRVDEKNVETFFTLPLEGRKRLLEGTPGVSAAGGCSPLSFSLTARVDGVSPYRAEYHSGATGAASFAEAPVPSLAPVRWEVPASTTELGFSANAEVPAGCVLTLTLRHFTVTDA